MLDVEVVPEMAIRHKTWEFILGMPVQQMIDILRKLDQTIRSVDFWFNDKSPFSSNLAIVLPKDGLRFYFDPLLQRLRLIEICDLSKITLRYWSQYFNSPTIPPTIHEILRVFGSTKPPAPSDAEGEYRLRYRGITFILKPLPAASGDSQSSPRVAFGGTGTATLIVTKIFIYLGNNMSEARVSPDLPSSCFLQNVFLERLVVERSDSVTQRFQFHLIAQELPTTTCRAPPVHRFTRSLAFGDCVQDVLSALGSPSRIFYKTEDKMRIHLPQAFRLEQPRRSDYFFNYFTLGVDVLFDARFHRVSKFVLHTNQPGEYTFNTYYRCMFEIPLRKTDCSSSKSPDATATAATTESQLEAEAGTSTTEIPVTTDTPSSSSDAILTVTPFSSWPDIREHVAHFIDAEPVVIHRDAKPQINPFGPTHAYGFQDIIFEIIPINGCLASVAFYSPMAHSLTGKQ